MFIRSEDYYRLKDRGQTKKKNPIIGALKISEGLAPKLLLHNNVFTL